jgi:hypothetical protein
LNSIQCARIAKAFDVLIYASEDKAFNESMAMDQEIENKKREAKAKSKK